MTQEEKQLLLKDLCARLPYGVMIEITSDGGMVEASYDMRLDVVLLADLLHSEDDFIPYLRPMSSMTDDERRVLLKWGTVGLDENGKVFDVYPYGMERNMAVIDFLNARHFDYRDLILKGLALEAPEGMYNF